MRLFSSHTLIIRSPLTPAEAADRLGENVEPRRRFRFHFPLGWLFGIGARRRMFEGESSGGWFLVRRVISYQNDFRPALEGRIEADGQGSRIRVTVRMDWITRLFVLLLPLMPFAMPRGAASEAGLNLAGQVAIVFFGAAVLWGFWAWEAARARHLLAAVFEASSVERG